MQTLHSTVQKILAGVEYQTRANTFSYACLRARSSSLFLTAFVSRREKRSPKTKNALRVPKEEKCCAGVPFWSVGGNSRFLTRNACVSRSFQAPLPPDPHPRSQFAAFGGNDGFASSNGRRMNWSRETQTRILSSDDSVL